MINADIKEVIIPSNIFNDSFFLFALCNIFIILYKFKFIELIVSWLQRIINMFRSKQSIWLSTGCS